MKHSENELEDRGGDGYGLESEDSDDAEEGDRQVVNPVVALCSLRCNTFEFQNNKCSALQNCNDNCCDIEVR